MGGRGRGEVERKERRRRGRGGRGRGLKKKKKKEGATIGGSRLSRPAHQKGNGLALCVFIHSSPLFFARTSKASEPASERQRKRTQEVSLAFGRRSRKNGKSKLEEKKKSMRCVAACVVHRKQIHAFRRPPLLLHSPAPVKVERRRPLDLREAQHVAVKARRGPDVLDAERDVLQAANRQRAPFAHGFAFFASCFCVAFVLFLSLTLSVRKRQRRGRVESDRGTVGTRVTRVETEQKRRRKIEEAEFFKYLSPACLKKVKKREREREQSVFEEKKEKRNVLFYISV